MNNVTQLILALAPEVFKLVQERHAANNPDLPPLTAAEVVAGFEAAFTDSIAKDEMIKAALAASS